MIFKKKIFINIMNKKLLNLKLINNSNFFKKLILQEKNNLYYVKKIQNYNFNGKKYYLITTECGKNSLIENK